jgi:hypothetical protein
MRALRGWWNGLRPGDRRLAGLFVGMIAATLPFYVVGAVLATDYGGRLAQRADRSADPESAAMTPRTPSPTPASSNGSPPVGVAASPIPQPTPPPGPTSTLAPSPTARPTAPASLTEVPRAGATPGARNGSAGGQSGPAATVGVAGSSPMPRRSPSESAELRCQSLPGSVSPGRYFDVVESTARRVPSGELVVEGVVHNNCNRPLRAVVHAEARDARGGRVAARQVEVGRLAPEARRQFEIPLGRLRTPPAVVVVGADRDGDDRD